MRWGLFIGRVIQWGGAALLLAACGGGNPAATTPAPTQSPQSATGGQATAAEPATAETTEQGGATSGLRQITVKRISGTVEAQIQTASFSPAEVGQVLTAGDAIQTSTDSWAVLEMDDGAMLAVAPESTLQIEILEGTAASPITRVAISQGQVFTVRAEPLPAGASYEVAAANGTGSIRSSAMSAGTTEQGTVITCLAGHCGAATGSQTVDLTGGQACLIGAEGLCSPKAMDASQMQAWARALHEMEEAGVAASDAVMEEGCACTGTTYTCLDGRTIAGHAACLAGTECSCEGATLTCADDNQYENDPACSGEASAGLHCQCSGPHLYCNDGTVSYNAPSCTTDAPCICNGTTLLCGMTIYANDPSCALPDDTSTCNCQAGLLVCPDGTKYFNTPACSTNLPCQCQGADLVCSRPDGPVTYPGACGSAGAGGLPTCACIGADLYCADGSISRDDASCAAGGTDSGGDTGGQRRCACYDGTLTCSDGTIIPNDPSCPTQP